MESEYSNLINPENRPLTIFLISASGGATSTAPAAGFADSTLASSLQKRVGGATVTSSTLPSTTPSDVAPSRSVNSGAIAGGVVSGVVALALITGIAWFLIRRRRQNQAAEMMIPQQKWEQPVPPQEMEATYSWRQEAEGMPIHEVAAESHPIHVESGIARSGHMLTEYIE